MTSVVSEIDITLASVADPHLTVRGKLVSIEGKYAEAALEGTTLLSAGALVQFQTAETLYLGAVDPAGPTRASITSAFCRALGRPGSSCRDPPLLEHLSVVRTPR